MDVGKVSTSNLGREKEASTTMEKKIDRVPKNAVGEGQLERVLIVRTDA